MGLCLVSTEALNMHKMFKSLHGVNNLNPSIEQSTSAVRCLKCFSAIIVSPEGKNALTASSDSLLADSVGSLGVPLAASSVRTSVPTSNLLPYGTCKCLNVSCMLDEQSTLRVYVDDIRTVHIGYAVLGNNDEILRTSFLGYSETFVYTDYTKVANEPLTLVTKGAWAKKVAKPPKVMDLTEALDLSTKAQGRVFFYDTKD